LKSSHFTSSFAVFLPGAIWFTGSGKENAEAMSRNGTNSIQIRSSCGDAAAGRGLGLDVAAASARAPWRVGAGGPAPETLL